MVIRENQLKCSKCGVRVDRDNSEGGFCMDCIVSMSSNLRSLSSADKRRLKAEVEAETSGLMSMEVLKGLLEDAYERLSKGDGFDLVIDDTANQIQRLAGLGAAREMLKFTQALGGLAVEQEEEIRRKIRKLAALGKS